MAHVCALSRDSTFPVDGAILPGGGSVVKMLEFAIGQYVSLCLYLHLAPLRTITLLCFSPPEAVIGKPSQDLLKTILATYNLDASRTCMVRLLPPALPPGWPGPLTN